MAASVVPLLGAFDVEEPPVERECEGCHRVVFVQAASVKRIEDDEDVPMVMCHDCMKLAMSQLKL